MNLRTAAVLAVGALGALAVWPRFVATHVAQASVATPAPVVADYLQRDRLVAFYEDAVAHRADQIVTRLLAAQYLQRFRETGDAADLLRGEHLARRSLALQPRFNAGAELTLASALGSLHRFREALAHAENARAIEPGSTNAAAHVASTEVELGRYAEASAALHSAGPAYANDAGLATATARFDEVTGKLAAARRSIDLAMSATDSIIDSPAESRAWFHYRAAELVWSAGDGEVAEQRFREALAIFPSYQRAHNGLARVYWGALGWALVRAGRCGAARIAARKAVRAGTQDARLQYHAGVIAMECGDRREAARRLQLALALNPNFDPVAADDARARVARL